MGMTTNDAAEFLGISQNQISRLCKTGTIEAKKHGPMWDINVGSVEAYKSSHTITKKRPSSPPKQNPNQDQIDQNILSVLNEVRAIDLLNELEQRINSTDVFHTLGAAKTIRALLIDQPPKIEFIVPDANQNIQIQIGKVIPKVSQQDITPASYQLIQDSLDSKSSSSPLEVITVSLPEFLDCVVLINNARCYTIREIIMLESAILSEGEQAAGTNFELIANKICQIVSPGGITPAVRQLKAIGRVILRSVESYREEAPILDTIIPGAII